jgi:hypothetical protein
LFFGLEREKEKRRVGVSKLRELGKKGVMKKMGG